ncbi:MAG: hypothetical protein RR225_05930 [Clostridium sp.]
MRWYKHLYVGEKAKEKRFSIIQNIRLNRFQLGVHVITPASNDKNVLDIYPAAVLLENYHRENDELLILGIGADYFETLEVVRMIVDDMYRETGGFSLNEFLMKNEQR